MFGMQFFVNFETKFLIIFVKGIDNKIFDFTEIQNRPPTKLFFIRHTLEENQQKFCFKIDKKLHTKHHQINQILWFLTKKKASKIFQKVFVYGRSIQ